MQYVYERASSLLRGGLIIRQKEPTNLEMPVDQIDSYLTSTEQFYIRRHFPAPRIDRAEYQLRIDGAVRNPLALSSMASRCDALAEMKLKSAIARPRVHQTLSSNQSYTGFGAA